MKAIYLTEFGGVENFELREVEPPRLIAKSVKIKIKATAFNPIDYQMRSGAAESKLLKSRILGRELAGVVAEKDESVKSLAVGDEVFAYVGNLGSNGTYAEQIVVPEVMVAHKPSNLSFAQAAAIPLVGLTAFQTVRRCAIKAADKIFVGGGAGGVGSMIVRLLKIEGFENIFSTAGNDESRARLRSMGLADDRIFDYRAPGIAADLLSAAGGKMDFCLDAVGGKLSDLCAEIIKINGFYADITFLATEQARETLFGKAVTVLNISNYAYGLDGLTEQLKFYGEGLSFLKQKIETGILSPSPVEIVGGLSVGSVSKAHHLLESNLARGTKLVMEIN